MSRWSPSCRRQETNGAAADEADVLRESETETDTETQRERERERESERQRQRERQLTADHGWAPALPIKLTAPKFRPLTPKSSIREERRASLRSVPPGQKKTEADGSASERGNESANTSGLNDFASPVLLRRQLPQGQRQ
jgi:hypothetical protein